jgi:hypothetical protein
MEAFLVSTGVVALGEIGDKTQLLALCSPRASKGRGRSSPASWSPHSPTTRSRLLGNLFARSCRRTC